MARLETLAHMLQMEFLVQADWSCGCAENDGHAGCLLRYKALDLTVSAYAERVFRETFGGQPVEVFID